jgi:hypothetical protein
LFLIVLVLPVLVVLTLIAYMLLGISSIIIIIIT